jgi:hypothetical protein
MAHDHPTSADYARHDAAQNRTELKALQDRVEALTEFAVDMLSFEIERCADSETERFLRQLRERLL